MNKFFLIIVLLFLNGCKTSDLFKNVMDDFALEKKVIVHNESIDQEKIDIPLNGMVFVKENETIYSISNKYKVIPKDIIVDNNLVKPYNLKTNQILFLRNKNIYIIKRGDNLDKISFKFAVNKSEIINLNKLKKPYTLVVGNKILIPKIRNYSIIDQIVDKKIYNSNSISYKTSFKKSKLIKNSPKFIWPAKGEVIKKFGKFGKGQHYDGIDIKLINNSPIYSSQSGKVAFIGSQIKQFGNLILIKHNNGWLTAYSNIGKSSVKLEDKVTKGQVIAYSSSDKKNFHFQIRYNRKPVDPATYLN